MNVKQTVDEAMEYMASVGRNVGLGLSGNSNNDAPVRKPRKLTKKVVPTFKGRNAYRGSSRRNSLKGIRAQAKKAYRMNFRHNHK